jgi:hypothetical protein
MAHADWEVRFLEHVPKEARHHGDECDCAKCDLQSHPDLPSPAPNGLRLSGDGGAAAGVRCSRGLGNGAPNLDRT